MEAGLAYDASPSRIVPADVPSLRQTRMRTGALVAAKLKNTAASPSSATNGETRSRPKRSPLVSEPGSLSSSREVPASVPSLRHSSTPCATS
jgi:hypothetical protein